MERLTVHVDPLSSSENTPIFADVKVRGETRMAYIAPGSQCQDLLVSRLIFQAHVQISYSGLEPGNHSESQNGRPADDLGLHIFPP